MAEEYLREEDLSAAEKVARIRAAAREPGIHEIQAAILNKLADDIERWECPDGADAR